MRILLPLLLAAAALAPSVGAENLAADPAKLVTAARAQVGVTLTYDPAYRALAYPGGDVPAETGVCTDVLIRALRAQGIDLQKAVHEDMRDHFGEYPRRWGLRAPDRNIDHRRVPNLMTFLRRRGAALPIPRAAAACRPGDIMTWNLPGNLPHIGLVSDRRTPDGARPLILHNIGRGAQEEDILFTYPLTGHFRLALPQAKPGE